MIPDQTPKQKPNDYNLDFLAGQENQPPKTAFDSVPRRIVFFIVLLGFIVAFIVFWHPKPRPNYSKIKNFQDCANAGYPVMQSYPSQCTLPNGQFFIQEFVPEK